MRFLREFIIIILIILFVGVVEIITVNITEKTLEEINEKIISLEKIKENSERIKKVGELSDLWKSRLKILEPYMEHRELEEISNKITQIKINIENDKYDETKEKFAEVKFRIEHIKNKQKLSLENIF